MPLCFIERVFASLFPSLDGESEEDHFYYPKLKVGSKFLIILEIVNLLLHFYTALIFKIVWG